MQLRKLIKNRSLIQAATAVLINSSLTGFINGKIYLGKIKQICVPGLNCYSCPGAVGSCPVGSIQTIAGSARYNFSYYVTGTLMLFGILSGRLVCGFLCPFGFFQDMLYKIRSPKIKIPEKPDNRLRYLKYAVLLLPVILLPVFITDEFNIAEPFFCKWICPAGTLEGGVPLVIKNESLRHIIGSLFIWKISFSGLIITSSVFIYRPFCKYICPLGALYSLFNRFSFYRMKVDKLKCNGCKECEKTCKMNVRILQDINSAECIRCGECKSACTNGAISSSFILGYDEHRHEHPDRNQTGLPTA